MPAKHPFSRPSRHPAWKLVNPVGMGSLSAAAVLAVPDQYLGKLPLGDVEFLRSVPNKLYMLAIAFACGYGAATAGSWIQSKLLTALLQYQGWIFNFRSRKTKLWALLLTLVKGPRPFRTFQFQPYLPRFPLPDLDATLDRWLKVSRELVTEEEFMFTQQAVEEFRKNEGPKLQAFLKEKASNSLNWLHDYWLSAAYLSSRQPLPVFYNYTITSGINQNVKTDNVTRAAYFIHNALKMKGQLEREELTIVELQDLVPLCMDGFRYIFSGVRTPGEHIDDLKYFPNSTHIIVIRKGQYFRLEVYKNAETKEFYSVAEYKHLLKTICDSAEVSEEILPVSVLTSQQRSIWAKQRQQLAENNAEALKAVEESIFIVTLDESAPKDNSDAAYRMLTGEGNSVWFDKSFTAIFCKGGRAAFQVEHSSLDAMVFAYLVEYSKVYEVYGEDIDTITSAAKLPVPQRLKWNLEPMKEAIMTAKKEYETLINDLESVYFRAPYSKGVMKKFRVSPDGYCQMALQLAWYRMHKTITRTYEPATSRLFLLGRTETVNPVSEYSKKWVQAMLDKTSTKAERASLLRKAIDYQSAYRLDATAGMACDRHLVGLACASREMGMDYPKIFMDKAWQQPYKLSTSQTPTRLAEYGTHTIMETLMGTFGPGCPDGYGICYGVLSDELLSFGITSWKSCPETSSTKFAEALQTSFEEMKEVLSNDK